MQVNLQKYSDKRICVAVSGGRDSMALLHYLSVHGKEYGITLSALNCDHAMRENTSERDSAFVKDYCKDMGIPLHFFAAKKGDFKDESGARAWRLSCYMQVLESGKADLIATAHHLNDNAETVLFNLARGTALSGVCGITDDYSLGLIRPLITCSREDIDEYIKANAVPFVTDESNFTDDYTRNKIRHNVLPALEQAVHGAAKCIYRFSRLAADDEEYFLRRVDEIIIKRYAGNYLIKSCYEKVIFKRAAQRIVAFELQRHDYTAEHMQKLFDLQDAKGGKKFEFLGLVAIKEKDGIAIIESSVLQTDENGTPFYEILQDDQAIEYCGVLACAERKEYAKDTLDIIAENYGKNLKTLSFDIDAIPVSAVIRFRKAGDKFLKFGGGTNSLSDYLTDKKIPQSLRSHIPLVCVGSDVLIVGGVEISDKVKIKDGTKNIGVFICNDPKYNA